MKLGDAIQKRRGGKRPAGRPAPRSSARRGRGPHGASFAAWLIGLTVVGLASGYVLATRILFPEPPTPQDLVEIPTLQGLAEGRARERVLEAGLDLGPTEGLRHPAHDSGVVVGQAPLPGQLARRGEAVRLTVSLGPVREAIPEVGGLGEERALALLEGSGFEAAIDSVDSEEPLGTVLEVDPVAGTVLEVPGTVRLTVSRGPPLVPMPFLVGLPQQQALDSLAALGIGVSAVDTVFRFGRDQGLVVEQDPPADSLVLRGTGVRLSVGREGAR